MTWRINRKGYVVSTNRQILHRYILSYTGTLSIDHINRNKLDNRKQNLRIVSTFINNQNNNAVGVSYDKHARKWKAEFQRFGKAFYAGVYDTKEEAVNARIKAINNFDNDSEKTNKYLKEYNEQNKNHATGIRPSPHGRWVAKFCADNKVFHVGTFDTKEEAILKRQKAIEKYYQLKTTA